MNLILIGKQGSGKGTQGKLLEKKGFNHISTGDLLRNLEAEEKKKIEFYSLQGKFVPSDLVIEILKKRISKKDDKKGIVLDGFPRNIEQAEALEKEIKIDKIIHIYISDKVAVKRLIGRRYCENCGRGYNLETFPKPKNDGLCDICKIKLNKRKDDTIKAIKKRLEIYHKRTEPVLDYYKNKQIQIIRVDGEKDINKVNKEIIESLK